MKKTSSVVSFAAWKRKRKKYGLWERLLYNYGFWGHSIYGFLRNPTYLITEPYNRVKWFLQRGDRGWDDRAAWSIPHWLVEIIIPVLERLRLDTHGSPIGLTPGQWYDTLLDIESGFRAAKRITDWEGVDHYKSEMKTFRKGMGLFTKYFFNLWD